MKCHSLLLWAAFLGRQCGDGTASCTSGAGHLRMLGRWWSTRQSSKPSPAQRCPLLQPLTEQPRGDIGVPTEASDEDTAAAALPDLNAQFLTGLRVAELSTMWLVNGWSRALFPRFMLWARERFPHQLGNLNHSARFLDDFLPSLAAAAHTCTAASLHAVVPATGLPSLLSRVVDTVSINDRSLLPVIHIYTDS